MPWVAFAANGLWVLVIGLMGPSVPFIIDEFSIDYSQAGLIFTLSSVASLLGTFAGGWVSDYPRRRSFWIGFLVILGSGLIVFCLSGSFSLLLLSVFIFSLFGSPVGAIGQSVMLQMYPAKRGRYVSLSTMFAAAGSFLAPLLISASILAGTGWRGAFYAASVLALLLATAVGFNRLPAPVPHSGSIFSLFRLFCDKRILFTGVMIFFTVGIDLGYSYWLAEYFISCAGAPPELSGFAVGCYLAGVITGRFLNSKRRESNDLRCFPVICLAAAAAALLIFLNTGSIPLKLVFCFIYGAGTGPLFPSLMAAGTSLYPERPGAATAVLFSMMSLGGAVFPAVIGAIGEFTGIENAYYSLFAAMVPVTAGLLLSGKIFVKSS